ncbi:MAG: hypothetical protein ACYC97_13205 [Metallibacterium sp.]
MELIRCYNVIGVGTIIGDVVSTNTADGLIELQNPLLIGLMADGAHLIPLLVMPENESVVINENHVVFSYQPNKDFKDGYLKQVTDMKAAKSGIVTPAQAKISNISDFKRKP